MELEESGGVKIGRSPWRGELLGKAQQVNEPFPKPGNLEVACRGFVCFGGHSIPPFRT